MNRFKFIWIVLLIVIGLNSCVVMKINKDSPPLVDFGTPLIGHFRNGDHIKGGIYLGIFLTAAVSMILFSPTSEDGAIIPVPREVSDPIFYSSLGVAAGTAILVSPIDTAITYHVGNKKIIDFNEIPWEKGGKITKYQAIENWQIEQERLEEERLNKKRLEMYEDEIEMYRKKLLDGTITDEELEKINRAPIFKELLEKEINYYHVNQEIKNTESEKSE